MMLMVIMVTITVLPTWSSGLLCQRRFPFPAI
jgi:hypothetical protein